MPDRSSEGGAAGAPGEQRREHFRVQRCLPVTCVPIGLDGQPQFGAAFIGVVENISAGGLRITTPAAVSLQDVLRVRLPMPGEVAAVEGRALEAYARVRRVVLLPDRTPPHHDVALQLIFEREADRDDWVRLVDALQTDAPVAAQST